MVIDWTRFFDQMLPRSRAWDLTHDGPLRKYFGALGAAPEMVRDRLARTILELFPAYTSRLHDWSKLFGSLEDYTAEELAAAWAAFGGQDPRYLQDTLRSLGVDVYVHECWDYSVDPDNPTLRSPIPYIDTSYVLVNPLSHIEKNYLHQFGDGTEFGTGAQFGAYDGHFLRYKRYPCPDIEEEFPAYWYVCGETWPDYAEIPENKLHKLIRMIFKIKPLWSRVVLRVNTVPEREIQDVYTLTDPEYQDTVDSEDILRDR